MKRLAALALCLAAPALARKAPRAAKAAHARPAGAQEDPSRWFASRPGLLRIYEGRTAPANEDEPRAGASCEVVESHPRDSLAPGVMRESCTMIVGRKARPAAEISYELRQDGIWAVQAKSAGSDQAQAMSRLVLPSPVHVGTSWREPRGSQELQRSVKSAGGGCRAAGREFADCLVLAVVQKEGKKVLRKYSETYAAGVGLVEDAQWELVDVKGL